MKKVLLIALFAGLTAGTANAATLWMQFAGGATEVTLHPSDTIVVEIHMMLRKAGISTGIDTLTGMQFENQAAPGLVQQGASANSALPPGDWATGILVNGPLGVGTNQVTLSTVGGLSPPMSAGVAFIDYLIGYQVIHQNDQTGTWPITFNVDQANARPTMLKAGGLDWTLVVNMPTDATAVGKYVIGQGSPGYSIGYDVNTGDPLIVNCIPEPASLALLALGVVAGLRRRS